MRSALRHGLEAAAAFVVMEPVAYAAHRWVMHGPGLAWHESHHEPRVGLFERNDLYPVAFAAGTVTAMAIGARYPKLRSLLAVGAGVTAYGATYAFVHDGVVHRRVPGGAFVARRSALARRLSRAHRRHHVASGEPFGMLVPLGEAWRESAPTADATAARRSA
ncbi:MAG: sterol desaturase family protein [Acidimicrobiales bacterium]|nr:sterol desaturase family protein [Acidimicrobiales bacterium]